MRGIKLTERIRYIHCEGDGDKHGLLVLLGVNQWPTKAVEIYTQADFKKFYDNFVITEDTQAELNNPAKKVYACL